MDVIDYWADACGGAAWQCTAQEEQDLVIAIYQFQIIKLLLITQG
jgi:hypothetical protein